jgi:hypothetical protein
LEAKFFDEDRAWNGKLIRNVETELTKYSSGCGGLHEIRRPHHAGLWQEQKPRGEYEQSFRYLGEEIQAATHELQIPASCIRAL